MTGYLATGIGDNVTGGAGLYGTLASVMAGFAFTAIVLLVGAWLSADRKMGGDGAGVTLAEEVLAATGRALVGSFLGLLIMSVTYTALSSDLTNSKLALSENTILVDGFAGVGVALIYTIVAMLDATLKDPETRSFRLWNKHPTGRIRLRAVVRFARISACVMNPLIMGMVYDAVVMYEKVRYPSTGFSVSAIDVTGWVMLAAEVAAVSWAAWLITRSESARWADWADYPARGRAENAAAWVGLAFPGLAAIGYLVADNGLQDNSLIGVPWVYLILAAAFVVTTWATVQIALTSPGPPPKQERSPGAGLWRKLLGAGGRPVTMSSASPGG